MADLLLVADFGTQSVRVGLIDQTGILIAEHSTSYPTAYPHPGWAEQKPSDWINGFKRSLGAVIKSVTLQSSDTIVALSISATSSTVVPIDKNGNAIGDAILWMDCRAADQAEMINATRNPVLEYCGGAVSAEWLIPKILWNKQNHQVMYDQIYKFIEQLDFLNMYFTGELFSSQCNATCKANYVTDLGGWNAEFLASIGLGDFLDKIATETVSVGAPVGLLKTSLCEEFGLPNHVAVFQGCIDAYAGMIGLGAVREGIMATIMGTSFVELCLSPIESRPSGIWGPYKNALIDGYYVYEGGQVAAGSIIKWFKNLIGDIDYDLLSEDAIKSPIGSNGLITLDFFQGNRTPYKEPRLRGEIKGLTLSHTRGDIYRSLMESVAFGTRNVLETMGKGNVVIDEFVASGGVTKDTLWLSIIADVCNVPISIVNSSTYAGLMGSAIIAAISCNMYGSYEEAVSVMIKNDRMVEPDNRQIGAYDRLFAMYLEESEEAMKKLGK